MLRTIEEVALSVDEIQFGRNPNDDMFGHWVIFPDKSITQSNGFTVIEEIEREWILNHLGIFAYSHRSLVDYLKLVAGPYSGKDKLLIDA